MDIWTDFSLNGIDCGPVSDTDQTQQPGHFDRAVSRPEKECKFCKNNGESERVFKAHNFKDAHGKLTCPILRSYTCPICGAKGDRGHTTKYCPKKRVFTVQDVKRLHHRSKTTFN